MFAKVFERKYVIDEFGSLELMNGTGALVRQALSCPPRAAEYNETCAQCGLEEGPHQISTTLAP